MFCFCLPIVNKKKNLIRLSKSILCLCKVKLLCDKKNFNIFFVLFLGLLCLIFFFNKKNLRNDIFIASFSFVYTSHFSSSWNWNSSHKTLFLFARDFLSNNLFFFAISFTFYFFIWVRGIWSKKFAIDAGKRYTLSLSCAVCVSTIDHFFTFLRRRQVIALTVVKIIYFLLIFFLLSTYFLLVLFLTKKIILNYFTSHFLLLSAHYFQLLAVFDSFSLLSFFFFSDRNARHFLLLDQFDQRMQSFTLISTPICLGLICC